MDMEQWSYRCTATGKGASIAQHVKLARGSENELSRKFLQKEDQPQRLDDHTLIHPLARYNLPGHGD